MPCLIRHYSKQIFTTLYRRMNTQSQTPYWLLLLCRREVTTKRGNRIWKSCLLCTNLERCLIIKISVNKKIVLKLTVFVYIGDFYMFRPVFDNHRGEQCEQPTLWEWLYRMVPCMKTEAKLATETSSFIKKIDDERTPKKRKCYQWVTTRLCMLYRTACGVTLQRQHYIFKL